MAFVAGSRIGHYEVLSLAGSGGMGEVYHARDTQLKRDVAIKVLPPSLRDAERLSRFRREAEILASLNHAGIATIHGFVDSADVHAIVMEFVEGETLAQLALGPLDIASAEQYALQISAAAHLCRISTSRKQMASSSSL